MNAAAWSAIGDGIAAASGAPFTLQSRAPVDGGCINQCYRLTGGGRVYFVKLHAVGKRAMFEAEAAGLAEIAATATVRVPAPVCHGSNADAAWLVLEHIEFGDAVPRSMARLGEALAGLHRMTAKKFGWSTDNTIGATPQINTQARAWAGFWRECRLNFQLALAEKNGAPAALLDKGARLARDFEALLADCTINPALLHGDLWGGNAGFDRTGAPVIFDPAVYYGHREADLAMTELFGGFSAEFYAAYRATYALDAGYDVRKQLYNLYHVLNHFNLFGGPYAGQAEILIDRLLAEI
ncbi:MAG: fructosamine kinase family protein [Burkholderiales bacterium]